MRNHETLPWKAKVEAQDGKYFYDQQWELNGKQYIYEALQEDFYEALQEGRENKPPLSFPFYSEDEISRANYKASERVRKESEDIINKRAQEGLENWLHSADGQLAIDAAQPPPCGKGSAQFYAALNVPGEQGTAELTLKHLDAHPNEGCIVVHYEVDVFQEVFFGDIYLHVAGDMVVSQIDVNEFGVVIAKLDPFIPKIEVEGTGLTGDLIDIVRDIFIGDGGWKVLMTFASLVRRDHLADLVKPFNPLIVAPLFPQRPFPEMPRRLADIKLDDKSVSVLGLVCRFFIYTMSLVLVFLLTQMSKG